VALPLSLKLEGGAGTRIVSGLPDDALASIGEALIKQAAADGRPWDQLVTRNSSGEYLRVNAAHFNKFDFGDYWHTYVDGSGACTRREICASTRRSSASSPGGGATLLRAASAVDVLALEGDQPNGVSADDYYQEPTTNHYARLVHQYARVGYAFAYDDVGPTNAAPIDGHLNDSNPSQLTITLGATPARV
jgi:Beta-1,3-glucanase